MSWRKSDAERERQLDEIPEKEKKFYALPHQTGSELFKPLPARPARGSWLAEHEEMGQSVKSFLRASYRAQKHASYDTIYIEPLGDFEGPRVPKLDHLHQYLVGFFYPLRIIISKPTSLNDAKELHTREHDGSIQARTDTVLNWLKQKSCDECKSNRARSRTQIVCICVTTIDIYPDEAWNFVFGLADLVEGFGVWSFARMDPLFPNSSGSLSNESMIILHRSIKVIAHELSHLFGIRHCVNYHCLMNGSNHLDEMDERPQFLCPVCLRKLFHAIEFDVVERYNLLLRFFTDHEMQKEKEWLTMRISKL